MCGFLGGRLAPILLLLAVLAGASPARAVGTTLTVERSLQAEYGRTVVLRALLRYAGGPCAASPALPVMSGTLAVTLDGLPFASGLPFYRAFYRECAGGTWTAGADLWFYDLDIGRHVIEARYSGEPGLDASASNRVEVDVVPTFAGSTPTGLPLAGGIRSPDEGRVPGVYCERGSMQMSFTPAPDPPGRAPPAGDFTLGFVNYRISGCSYECGFLCPRLPPTRLRQQIQLQLPFEPADGTRVWSYAPTADDPNPAWREIPASTEGRLLTVDAEGGWIAGMPTLEGSMRGTLAISLAGGLPPAFDYAGMWFGGAAQNGWGLSVGQRGNRFSAGLYVYDRNGRATWLAMPAQDADTTSSFSGALQAPNATSPGIAFIRFSGPDRGTIEFVIDGVRGTRAIERIPAPPASDRARAYAGDWKHAPFGGGMTINAAGDGLFVGWQTYTAAGDGTWLIMTSGEWTAGNVFSGTLHRTRSDWWLAATYDPAALRVTPAGTMTLRFDDENRGRADFVVDGVSGSLPLQRRGP